MTPSHGNRLPLMGILIYSIGGNRLEIAALAEQTA